MFLMHGANMHAFIKIQIMTIRMHKIIGAHLTYKECADVLQYLYIS